MQKTNKRKQTSEPAKVNDTGLDVIDDALAQSFARLFVDNERNPVTAALLLFPDDTLKAVRMSQDLVKDERVKELITVYEKEREESLPTKAQFALDLLDKMKKTDNAKDFHMFAKLYADVRGFIDKPSDAINQNSVTVVVPSVMQVPTHQSDEEWEQSLAKQQADLMANMRTKKK